MKKIAICLMLLMTLVFSGCQMSCIGKTTINVFNVGNYIDTELISEFEEEYGVCVNYTTYDSNEAAMTKMETEKYDVVYLSDYAIEEMATRKMIKELDWSKIEGFTKNDVTTSLKTMLDNLANAENGFDLMNYSAPYFFGNVGLIYNKDVVKQEDLVNENWNILKSKEYKIAYYDSSRDGFMIALKQLGYSMNTTSADEVNKAYDWLSDMKKGNSSIAYITDEVLDDMPQLFYDIAVVYSGDGLYCQTLNEKLAFYAPTTGTNVFCDAMVIPSNTEYEDLAYKYISFMLRESSSMANTIEVGYSSAQNKTYEAVIASDGEYADYLDTYVVNFREMDEIFRFNPENKVLTDTNWQKFKRS